MTKFPLKSFSVYNNYAYVPKCDICGEEGIVFFQTVEGKLCQKCREIKKQENLLKKLGQK